MVEIVRRRASKGVVVEHCVGGEESGEDEAVGHQIGPKAQSYAGKRVLVRIGNTQVGMGLSMMVDGHNCCFPNRCSVSRISAAVMICIFSFCARRITKEMTIPRKLAMASQ